MPDPRSNIGWFLPKSELGIERRLASNFPPKPTSLPAK
jgi:hypothetical protein